MKKYVHDNNFRQVHLDSFDCSSKFDIIESRFPTSETTNFTLNPQYRCRTRRGYNLYSDHFNAWKLQETRSDYSRKEIAWAYQLGGGF